MKGGKIDEGTSKSKCLTGLLNSSKSAAEGGSYWQEGTFILTGTSVLISKVKFVMYRQIKHSYH